MTPDAVPPPNRFWPRRGEPDAGRRTRTAVPRAALAVVAVLAVAGGIAYKFGWFPFDDRSGLRAELLAAAVGQSRLPLQVVEITGDGMAVGTLPDGERLAIRWAREGGAIRTVCQRPQAEMEAWLRRKAEERYGPVKALAVRPSAVGVGYVGEVELESGETLDVVETTDLGEMWAYQDFWQSKKTYPVFAKRLLERALGAAVTDVSDGGAGDFPAQEHPGTERLHTARMKAGGAVYAVELYRDRPRDGDPNGLWGEVKLRYRKLGG